MGLWGWGLRGDFSGGSAGVQGGLGVQGFGAEGV